MNITFHNVSTFTIGEPKKFQSDGRTVHTTQVMVEYTDNYGKKHTQPINFYSEDGDVFGKKKTA